MSITRRLLGVVVSVWCIAVYLIGIGSYCVLEALAGSVLERGEDGLEV